MWQQRDFVKLWLGLTISKFGTRLDALTYVALITLAASPAQLGWLNVAISAPVLLVALFAGVWVDRLRRRPLMIVADGGRALLLASIPLAALLKGLTLAQVFIVAALVGALSVGFEVANHSYLPSLVERKQIVEGNSKLEGSGEVVELIAPAVGGGLVQLITAPMAVLVDALTFVASGLSVALIRKPEPEPQARSEAGNIWGEIGTGLRLLLGNRLLRALTLAAALDNFFGAGFYGTLYSYYALNELHLDPFIIGVIIGGGGVGGLIGAIYAARAARRFGLGRTIILSSIVAVPLGLLTPFAFGPQPLVIAMMLIPQVCGDALRNVKNINEVSLRQGYIPNRMIGRVAAGHQFLVGGVVPFGALVAGLLATLITARYALLIAVAGGALSTLLLIFSPLPQLRVQPEPVEIMH